MNFPSVFSLSRPNHERLMDSIMTASIFYNLITHRFTWTFGGKYLPEKKISLVNSSHEKLFSNFLLDENQLMTNSLYDLSHSPSFFHFNVLQ